MRMRVGTLKVTTAEVHQTHGRDVLPASELVEVKTGKYDIYGTLREDGTVWFVYASLLGRNEHGQLATYLWTPDVETLAALLLTGAQGDRIVLGPEYGVRVGPEEPGEPTKFAIVNERMAEVA